MYPLLLPKPSYLRAIFRARDWACIAVFFAFVLIAIGVAAGAYVGFLGGFRFFLRDAYFGKALILYALEATFFIVWVLVCASATVSGLVTLFGSQENQFLLATPFPLARLFVHRFLENALRASWPVALLGIPALCAFARVLETSIVSMVIFVLLLCVVVFLAVVLATLLDFTLSRVFRVIRGAGLGILIGVLVVAGAYLMGRVFLPANLTQLFHAESFTNAQANTDLIAAHFKNFPTHAMVLVLFTGTKNMFGGRPFWQLVAEVLVSCATLSVLAKRAYATLLARSLEGLFNARPEESARSTKGLKKFPLLFKGAIGTLIEKDVITFLRSTRETSRALFLVFMLFLYLFLFRRLPVRDAQFSSAMLHRILFFNLAVLGYFITTLSLRFVFPLISLEGRGAWATFASPVSRVRIFLEKLCIGVVPMFLVVVPLTIGSGKMLGLHGWALAVFARPAIGMVAVLVPLALAAGAGWPNFHDRDPDKLSTTIPGLAVTAVSLVYVATASFIGFLSIRAYTQSGSVFTPVILPLAALNLLLLGCSLWVGLYRFKRLDV